MNPFEFDPRAGTTGRFRNLISGRFVSEREVRAEMRRIILGLRGEMIGLAQQLKAAEVSLQEWYDGMRSLMKIGHTIAASMAKGGWKQMTFSDWGRVGAASRRQYEFLNNFATQMASGRVALDGRTIQRSGMYAKATFGTYQKQLRVSAKENAYRQERRIIDPSAEHCNDCIDEAAKGWQPIGTLREIGDSQCRVNCACRFEFRTHALGKTREDEPTNYTKFGG